MSVPKKRIKTPNIVTTANRGNSKRLIVVLVLFVIWTLAAYLLGHGGFGLSGISSSQSDSDSGRQLEQLRSEYQAFKERAEELGRTDQESSSGIIAQLRDERKELVKDMSILGSSTALQNLQLKIKDIEITPGSESGTFEYKVTIEPMSGESAAATGMLKLAIAGETNGKPEVFEVPQKAEGLEENHRVFDLSQQLTGVMKLPAKFSPEAITLELVTGNDTANPLTHKYTWSDVLSRTRAVRSMAGSKDKIIDDLKKENLALKIKLSKMAVAGQDNVASSVSGEPQVMELQQQRDAMAQEIEQLKQKVIDLKGRFVIPKISIDTDAKDGGIEFRVTVSRSVNDGERIQGAMTVALAGTEGGEDKLYTLDKLTSGKKSEYVLGFKNYQEIKQPLILPNGFEPEKLIVHIVAENNEMQELNQEFDWKTITK